MSEPWTDEKCFAKGHNSHSWYVTGALETATRGCYRCDLDALRAEIQTWKKNLEDAQADNAANCEENDRLRAEVERLRDEVEARIELQRAYRTELTDSTEMWGHERDRALAAEARAEALAEALRKADLAMHVAQRYIRAGECQPPYFDRHIPTLEQLDAALVVANTALAAEAPKEAAQ